MYKDHVTIHSGWNELQPYGINALTGEADAYSLRILCDLSEAGKQLIETFLGGQVTFTKGANWNGYVGEAEAVTSVMLPYSIFDDLRRFILFHIEDMTYVYKFSGGSMSGTCEEYDNDALTSVMNTYVNYPKLRESVKAEGQERVGDRNVHQATGRTV